MKNFYVDDRVSCLGYLAQAKEVCLDIETTGLHFMHDEIKLVTVGNGRIQFIFTEKWDFLAEALKDKLVIIQNAQFDITFLAYKSKWPASWYRLNIYDTMLVERIIQGNTFVSASLKALVKRYLDKDIKQEETTNLMTDWHDLNVAQLKYVVEDIEYLLPVKDAQTKHRRYSAQKTIVDLEHSVLPVVIQMRLNGIRVNKKSWIERSKKDMEKYERIRDELDDMIGHEIVMWTSEKQVKAYFRSYQDIEISSYTKLNALAAKYQNKVLHKFIELRHAYQSAHTFGEAWLETQITKRAPIIKVPTIHPKTSRVHPRFTQILNTGRFSCAEPNLQQIPRDPEIRKCFVASPDGWLVIGDFSGIEAGIAATLAKEEKWLKAMRTGQSVHDLLAQDIFGVDFTKEQRQNSKTANFTMLYGSGAARLAETLNIKLKEAKVLVYGFRKSLPRLWGWMQAQARKAERTKLSTSAAGRIRDLSSLQFTYTIGLNNPIQSTAADIMKLAMVLVDRELQSGIWPVDILLTVHDELITEVYGSKIQAKEWAQKMKELMEEAANRILNNDYLIKCDPVVTQYWQH